MRAQFKHALFATGLMLTVTSGAFTANAATDNVSISTASASVVGTTAMVSTASMVNVGNRTTFKNVQVADSGVMNFDGENVQLMAVSDGSNGSFAKGVGLWVMPIYQNTKADGFEAGSGSYDYDSDFFGASLGADYTFANDVRLGAAFHAGSGSSESHSAGIGTDNDFDFFGLSIYGGYVFGNIGLSADIGYTQTSNDLTSGAQSADFDSDSYTAGVRLEYNYNAGFANLIPYIGMRVNYMDVDAYNTHEHGKLVYRSDSTDATTFSIPLGVTIAKSFVTASNFTLTPSADLGVQFTMGDLDVDSRTHDALNNINTMSSEVFDPVTFQGGLGLGIAKGNLSFDVEYDLNASSNLTSQTVMGTFRFDF